MLFVQFMLRYIYLVFPNLKSAKRRALCVFVCVIMCVCSLATKGSPQCKEAWPVPIYTHTLFILPFVTHSYTSMPAPLYVVILFKGSLSACCAHALLYIRGEVNQQMHTRCATLLKRITFPPLFTAEPENHTPHSVFTESEMWCLWVSAPTAAIKIQSLSDERCSDQGAAWRQFHINFLSSHLHLKAFNSTGGIAE